MIKALKLCSDLFIAIKNQEWYKANEIVEELRDVLATYKISC